jgi:hypothetical protein
VNQNRKMASVPQIENWKEHLAVLLSSYETEPEHHHRSSDVTNQVFTDEFGNAIDFSHSEAWCFLPFLDLLKAPASKMVKIDVDRGHLSYRLFVFSESYFLVTQLKVNMRPMGKFDSFIVLRSLDPLIHFLEKLTQESNDDNDDDQMDSNLNC